MNLNFVCELEKLGFNLCRICLRTSSFVELNSLFDNNGEGAEKLLITTGIDLGIDVSDSKQKQLAMICKDCSVKLDNAYKFKQRAEYALKNYFLIAGDKVQVEEEFKPVGKVEIDEICMEISIADECIQDRSNLETRSNTGSTSDYTKNENHEDFDFIPIVKGEKSEIMKPAVEVIKFSNTSLNSNSCACICSCLCRQNKTGLQTGLIAKVEREEWADLTAVLDGIQRDTSIFNKVPVRKCRRSKVEVLPKEYEEIKAPYGKSFKCPKCDKSLGTKNYLRHHINRVHKKISNFFCHLCDNKFYYKHHLIYHMEVHKTKNEQGIQEDNRNYKCDLCGKLFATNEGLQQHQIVHSNIRPFVCSCGKSFKTKGILKTHQKNLHQKY